MSLFKIRMFVPDAPPANPLFVSDDDAFGPSYGNRIASEQRFRAPWEALRRNANTAALPGAEACCDSSCC